MVRVSCVHRDVAEYPVVRLAIQFRGQKHNVEVSVNPHLRPWWNGLIVPWKQWVESSFTRTPKIGTSGWNPFCSLCGRYRKPPQGFPPSSSCTAASPAGFWTSWGRLGRGDLRGARMKFSMCWTWEQNSTLWGSSPWRICYRPRTSKAGYAIGGPDYAISHREIKCLCYSTPLALNYSPSGKDCSRSHGGSGISIMRWFEWTGARQIYHLNLLKKWSEVEPVMLATVVSGEEDLGPEVSTKIPSLTLAPGGDHLSPSQLTDVARLQKEFADVFSPLPGRTNLIQHHIETEPGIVVRSWPYRLPEHKKKVVQSELEAMLEMGVIEESHSDWASPIVLVPKTDGSVLCGLSQGECGVEVRRLSNAAGWRVAWSAGYRSFLFDAGLTQRILADPLIQRKVSLHNAVWITPICHTSVWVVRGARYLSAPHGQNPPTAHATAYLDDIIIYSQDWQRHMVIMREVLRALRGAGLTANPKKCAIGRVEVRYLGFHLGHGQVRPQIDKTAAIAACPRPKTKKEVRQFLGLAGYYRRFIPDYSELTSPLTDLTKKEVPDTVPWMERCQQAFTQVRAALCGGPLLHSPDFSLPFLLQTDASDQGLGAVLTQEIGGEERPVLYISRKLSKRETMYSTIEKECLAIRWVVLTLRYYLLGREFTLCSDHAPLQWLHRMKDTNARITRWYLALQPFKFKVIHRPGKQMTVADFLSRNGGGGGLQAGGLPGLSRAVGVCGEGGVVQRSLQREKDSGDSGK